MRKQIIILVALIIILIGVWGYLFFTLPGGGLGEIVSSERTPETISPTAPPVERYEFEGIEYEIISAGGSVYDVLTGKITEEQARALAEKIIGDILIQKPDVQEITLLFYSDLITLGVGQVDVAEVSWTPEETSIIIK